MITKLFHSTTLSVWCVFTLLRVHVCAAPPAYTVTVLDYFGTASVGGFSINNSGQIAVTTTSAGSTNPYRLTGSTLTALPTLSGSYNTIGAINDSGQITGLCETVNGLVWRAVRWTGTTRSILFGLGGTYAEGRGINASGQIAGSASPRGDLVTHAVRWTGLIPTDLGTLGGQFSEAYAINASGQVAGVSEIALDSTNVHAVRWTGTTAEDLGTLGGNNSFSYDINDSGQVVGGAETSISGVTHAVRWDGTTPTDLGTLGGHVSYATSINASGDIIGVSSTADPNFFTAFLFAGGTMYNLLSLLDPGLGIVNLNLSYAHSINDHGQILVAAEFAGSPSASTKLVRLDPILVPEPASAVLLLGGAALFGLRRRR